MCRSSGQVRGPGADCGAACGYGSQTLRRDAPLRLSPSPLPGRYPPAGRETRAEPGFGLLPAPARVAGFEGRLTASGQSSSFHRAPLQRKVGDSSGGRKPGAWGETRVSPGSGAMLQPDTVRLANPASGVDPLHSVTCDAGVETNSAHQPEARVHLLRTGQRPAPDLPALCDGWSAECAQPKATGGVFHGRGRTQTRS